MLLEDLINLEKMKEDHEYFKKKLESKERSNDYIFNNLVVYQVLCNETTEEYYRKIFSKKLSNKKINKCLKWLGLLKENKEFFYGTEEYSVVKELQQYSVNIWNKIRLVNDLSYLKTYILIQLADNSIDAYIVMDPDRFNGDIINNTAKLNVLCRNYPIIPAFLDLRYDTYDKIKNKLLDAYYSSMLTK